MKLIDGGSQVVDDITFGYKFNVYELDRILYLQDPKDQCIYDVFVDTGIRTGTDVLKALALGARAIFIGRPILYGLARGGHHGVKRVLEILKRELTYDMAYCGLTSIDQINKNILYKHG
ncbi:unnamed protein product [Rotaria sordida]|uniref:FMN hydroxy acid dehydrogenase domain-containing protein n=1 Tax=Rotaria sordida TaxID=392033 RepID=A0A819KA57_9BILA|nr:unnamed protein product [Rotaria sordida]CAF1340086.1 unnamed protein product [Rotaria sordida]CAF1340301.1 unnamed protein product [Rotaria sordida]CAF1348471.1 unnamed protein product [Rotaria sordida]CAF1439373.1 unnamed protein product [Rotaria sordida]